MKWNEIGWVIVDLKVEGSSFHRWEEIYETLNLSQFQKQFRTRSYVKSEKESLFPERYASQYCYVSKNPNFIRPNFSRPP
jgi:hypothetical protein